MTEKRPLDPADLGPPSNKPIIRKPSDLPIVEVHVVETDEWVHAPIYVPKTNLMKNEDRRTYRWDTKGYICSVDDGQFRIAIKPWKHPDLKEALVELRVDGYDTICDSWTLCEQHGTFELPKSNCLAVTKRIPWATTQRSFHSDAYLIFQVVHPTRWTPMKPTILAGLASMFACSGPSWRVIRPLTHKLNLKTMKITILDAARWTRTAFRTSKIST